jgi:hypothetical protein
MCTAYVIIMLLKLIVDLLTLFNDSHVALLTCVYDCYNDSSQQQWFIHLGTAGQLSSAVRCDLVFLVENLEWRHSYSYQMPVISFTA